MTDEKKMCSHSVCGAGECHFALPPASIEHYERQRPLWDIEKSGVRIGQRYKAFQRHLGPCRIVSVGLSTHLGHLTAMVAFQAKGVTYLKTLGEFTDSIAGHKRWELISDSHDELREVAAIVRSSGWDPSKKPNDHTFHSAVGKCIKGINFARLSTVEPRMRIEISLAGACFVVDDCDPITREEADAVIGLTIARVTVEINDHEDQYWLPARLSIAAGKHTLDLVAHAPIFYMDDGTRMFVRFPVPSCLKDDRRGFNSLFEDSSK